MAFPQSLLGTQLEMQINGTWTSVIRYDTNTKLLKANGIKITRGIGGLQDKTPPGTCTWAWQDPNGIFSNENPRSPYYGVLPRNTPVRVYVPRSQAALYCRYGATGLGNGDGIRASCPDTAGNSISGDIDIRVEFEPLMFMRFGNRDANTFNSSMVLASKYVGSTNRGWYFRILETGTLGVGFSSSGSNSGSNASSLPIDLSSPRTAVRVTIDVDNGSGNSVITFYQAPSLAGSWTQIGTQQTNAAFTFFNNTAAIELGSINSGSVTALQPNFFGLRGRIYGFELYSGIGGTLVAKFDPTAKANGTTSFADGLGNTWTVGSAGEITNAEYRFHGEFSAPVLNPNKSKNGTGLDIQIDGEAGGIIRRLQVNDAPLHSPLYRLMTSSTYNGPSANGINGYITGEDASAADTTTASSGITGANPAVISDITFNGPDLTLPGSAGVMTLGSTAPSFIMTCKAVKATTELHFVGMFKFPSIPVVDQVVFQIHTIGSSVVKWTFDVSSTGYGTRGYDVDGVEVVTKTTTFGTGAEPNKWIAFHLQLTNNSGTVDIKPEWMEMDSGLLYGQQGIGTVSFSGVPGTISSVVVSGVGLAGMKLAHVLTSSYAGLIFWDSSTPLFARVAKGYKSETADARFIRICGLIGVRPVIFGQLGGTEQMGAEPIDSGINVLYECAAVDGGMIIEATDQPATLEYWTRNALENQVGTLALTWAQLSEGLKATPDDTDVANDILLTRRNGGTAAATLTFGPMSVQPPPNGINEVTDGPTINNFADSRLPALAQYLLLRRTWPTSRYPSVVIQMERADFSGNAALFLLAMRQQLGMRLKIGTLPNFMAPETIDLLPRGITENLSNFEWQLNWACVPYGPYLGSELGTTTPLQEFQYKAAHTTLSGVSQQQLNAAITASATSFAAKTLSGVLFDTAATNIPIMVDGELMTVGSVSGTSSPQTLNSVTRGVNGVPKIHSVSAQIIVYPTLKARL
jgi:hypothetical protein